MDNLVLDRPDRPLGLLLRLLCSPLLLLTTAVLSRRLPRASPPAAIGVSFTSLLTAPGTAPVTALARRGSKCPSRPVPALVPPAEGLRLARVRTNAAQLVRSAAPKVIPAGGPGALRRADAPKRVFRQGTSCRTVPMASGLRRVVTATQVGGVLRGVNAPRLSYGSPYASVLALGARFRRLLPALRPSTGARSSITLRPKRVP